MGLSFSHMYTKNFYNNKLKTTSRILRNKMTFAEKKLWQQLLRKFKYRAHRQRPLGDFIADFYIPKAKLVIEVDGEIHSDPKQSVRDMDRTRILNNTGIKVIRFTNDQIINNIIWVSEQITTHVNLCICENEKHPLF